MAQKIKSNKKAYLVRAYTAFNLGDDLFLKILFERYPRRQFLLFTRNEAYLRFVEKYANVRILYFNKVEDFVYRIACRLFDENSKVPVFLYKYFFQRNCAKRCDGYLSLGGSIFIQNVPRLTRKDYVFESIVSAFANKPKFVVGANFGPVKSDSYVSFYTNLFYEFTDVCFRESYSYKLFESLNVVRYAADVVFQLKMPKVVRVKDSIGFSVINLERRDGLREYADKYYSLIGSLLHKSMERGKKTFLISFCASEGDEAAIDKILELLSMEERGEVNLMFYKGDVDNFLLEYLSLESVFTTRFHAMILSILGGQNIYPLIYSDKMENVLNDLEYCGTSLRIDKMEEALNEEKMLLDMANNRCSLDNVRQKSLEQFKVLDLYLNEETR